MKRIKIILALLLLGCLTLPSFAQTLEEEDNYIPFVEQGKTWWYLCTQMGMYLGVPQFGENNWGVFGLTIQGKRVIDGTEWDEIHLEYPEDAICPIPCAFIREENKRVYTLLNLRDEKNNLRNKFLTDEEIRQYNEYFKNIPDPIRRFLPTAIWVNNRDEKDWPQEFDEPILIYDFSGTTHTLKYFFTPYLPNVMMGESITYVIDYIDQLEFGDKKYNSYVYRGCTDWCTGEIEDIDYDAPVIVNDLRPIESWDKYMSSSMPKIMIEGVGELYVGWTNPQELFYYHMINARAGTTYDSVLSLLSVTDAEGNMIFKIDEAYEVLKQFQSASDGVEELSMDNEMEIDGSVIRIRLQGNDSGLLSIYSIDGTKVCEYPVSGDSEERISLPELTKGVYIATLEVNGKTITRKFVK